MELDTKADINFYLHLVDILGEEETDKIAPEIFAEDLRQLSWEISRSDEANFFYYKIQGENLIHQRDLSLGEDILTKVNPSIRQGLEYSQMCQVKSRLLQAPEEAIVTWVSPKKILDSDPNYPLDQINIAKKIDQETIWVKQLQGDLISLEPDQTLEELMLTIGESEEIYNLKFEIFNEISISNDTKKGREYVQALKMGLSADSLRVKRAELLQDTFLYTYSVGGSIQTSCGVIDFGGSTYKSDGGSSSSESNYWASYSYYTGEYSCRFCHKSIWQSKLSSHRCVC